MWGTSLHAISIIFFTDMQLPDASASSVFARGRRTALTIIKCYSNFGNLCSSLRRKSKYFSRGGLPEDLGFVPESSIVCQLILEVACDILLSAESFLSTNSVLSPMAQYRRKTDLSILWSVSELEGFRRRTSGFFSEAKARLIFNFNRQSLTKNT